MLMVMDDGGGVVLVVVYDINDVAFSITFANHGSGRLRSDSREMRAIAFICHRCLILSLIICVVPGLRQMYIKKFPSENMLPTGTT